MALLRFLKPPGKGLSCFVNNICSFSTSVTSARYQDFHDERRIHVQDDVVYMVDADETETDELVGAFCAKSNGYHTLTWPSGNNFLR